MRFPRIAYSLRLARQVPAAVRLVTDPDSSRSYHPAAARKSRARMIAENLYWLVRHGEPCSHYFAAGLDRRGIRLASLVPYRDLRRLRDVHNRAAPAAAEFDCICLLRDKFVFGLVARALGVPSPATLALLTPESVEWFPDRERAPLEAVVRRELDGFCKPVDGIEGVAAFSLTVRQGSLLLDGRTVTPAELRARLTDRFILQERIQQHPALAALHPGSVNTLRVVTARTNGRPRVLLSFLRVGVGPSQVDNFAAGGVLVSVDPRTGRLRGKGLTREGRLEWIDRHPDTGVAFDGYPLPFVGEALAVARAFHDDIPRVHSIGWDIAITPAGPCVIEGNDNWGARNVILLEPDFGHRFLSLFEEADQAD